MLAPNWEDDDAEKNLIVNYFAERQHTELVIKKIEMKIIKTCFYCRTCENSIKFSNYKKIFNGQGFWTFNKHIRCWNVLIQNGLTRTKTLNCFQLGKLELEDKTFVIYLNQK